MTRRQQLTYITGGFVIVSLIVLGARWSVLGNHQQLPVPTQEVVLKQEKPAPKSNYTLPAKPRKPKPSRSKSKQGYKYKKSSTKLLDINKASAKSLEALPGLGPVLAKRIVAYRETNGPFSKLADLDHVEGIGQKKLSELEGLLTF